MPYQPPDSGSSTTPCCSRSRSTIAFLTIFWQAGTLDNCELRERPETGNSPSAGIQRAQSRAFVPSNSCPKSVVSILPMSISTRSADRRCRFAWAMAAASPSNATRPGRVIRAS